MAEAHSEELPRKDPKFKNKPLSDSRYDKEDVEKQPSLKLASSYPLIETDGVEEEPFQDLLLSDADSQKFMTQKQYSSKRPPNMEEIDVECVIIDQPEVVKRMINNGCISLSEVHAFHRPPKAACDAIFYLTIPFDYKQEFVDGSFMRDGSGKLFLGRIFVLYYSTELDTFQILRPEISEHGGTFAVTDFCFGWLFGCESTVNMLRWDTDYDILSVVLCKEAYLTGSKAKVSLLESQNVQRDLSAYLEYHTARLAKESEMQFDDAQHSKRCLSALEFFKKCLIGSTIRSYEHLPITSIFSGVKKLQFNLSVLDSKLMEIGKSRKLNTDVDQVREHKKLLPGFDKNNLNNLKYYKVDVKATSIFGSFKPFGPFYLEPNGAPVSKQCYEAVLDQRQGGQEGKHWKLAVILCAFSDRSGNPTREIKKLRKVLRESGYTIIHVTERELRKEDFNTVIEKFRRKLKEGICGIKVWIIAHGEERGELMISENDEFKKLVDLFITTDDGHEIKVPEFLSSLSGIAQESREKMNLEFPVICNICCCRGMKKDDMTEGGKIFSETPSDVHVMYSASSGQLTNDNSTFIDEWVKYYAFDFAEKKLGQVATEIRNNVNDLNGMQRPRILEELKHPCLNGVYMIKNE